MSEKKFTVAEWLLEGLAREVLDMSPDVIEVKTEWRISWDSPNVKGTKNAFIAESKATLASSLDSLRTEGNTGIEVQSRTVTASPWKED